MFLKHEFKQEFNTFNQRMSNLEHAVKRFAPTLDIQRDLMQEDDHGPDSPGSDARQGADDAYSSSPGEATTVPQAGIDTMEARIITRNMEDETEVEPGPHVRPGVPTIPLNHTTLAALLLKWRPIERLVRNYLDAENVKFVEEFPIRQEERRGLLRVWGRGEGLDSSRSEKDGMRDFGMMEVHDDYSDAPSPADCWGGISGSPGPTEYGIRPLDFSDSTVWKYVDSYERNIQNMHPLIIPVELKAMVTLFLNDIRQSTRPAGLAKFVGTAAAAQQAEAGVKRKRSPAPEGGDISLLPNPVPARSKPMFQRSINNALVLLVLALGKICLVKDKKIPDVVPASEPSHGSPIARNGHPASPIQGSPPSYGSQTHSSGLPSPKEGSERSGGSRRASFQGGAPHVKPRRNMDRNMDVIPGLDYFAYATDIIGGQLAGTSLRHIHAHILAGLYHGQLGRVMESYAHIKEAGMALQIKMRP